MKKFSEKYMRKYGLVYPFFSLFIFAILLLLLNLIFGIFNMDLRYFPQRCFPNKFPLRQKIKFGFS